MQKTETLLLTDALKDVYANDAFVRWYEARIKKGNAANTIDELKQLIRLWEEMEMLTVTSGNVKERRQS